MNLLDRVVVVTGAGGAFAREIVLQLLDRGARVAAVDHRGPNLAETEARASAGDRLSTHLVALDDRAAYEALPAAVLAAHGQVDVLAHVGGTIHAAAPILELPVDQIEPVIAANVLGTIYINKAFLPHLLRRSESALINFSHAGALAPVAGLAGYTASRAANRTWTETLALELEDAPITVTIAIAGEIGSETTPPADAARQTIEAIEQGPARVLIGPDAEEAYARR